MEEYQILIIIIPPLAAALGFLLKFLLERRTENRLKLDKHLLERVQFKLREFYQPILTNLIRENSIFENLIKFHRLNIVNNEMKLALDGEILDIHLETQKLIQMYLIDINPAEELLYQLVEYDKHVLLFSLLRKYKIEDNASDLEFPGAFGAPYPHKLQKMIEKKITELRQKQNRLVGNWKEHTQSEPY